MSFSHKFYKGIRLLYANYQTRSKYRYFCQPKKIVYKLMQENLVIVESPAKAKKIEEFLGKDYKVMSLLLKKLSILRSTVVLLKSIKKGEIA